MRLGEAHWEFWAREVDASQREWKSLQTEAKALAARFHEREANLRLLKSGVTVRLGEARR
jgi:hypothetical protein